MPINFLNETVEIISDLKNTDDYAGAERVIINKIKKHLSNKIKIPVIKRHLKKILKYFKGHITQAHGDNDYIKFMYVISVINTLLQTNYWHSWITVTNPDPTKNKHEY